MLNNNDLKNKKLFIFDMDGTIYLGEQPFENAINYIKKLRENNKKVLFFTNNASHNHEFYLKRLNRMGFEATESELLSSADVTAQFILRNRKDKSVYLLGTPELYEQFKQAGVNLICDKDGKVIKNQQCDIVVTSFDTTLTYEKLVIACDYLRYGAEFLCTHPDFNCPTETGFIPDSGAIVALINASTGKTPRYFGKPYGDTVEMISSITGFSKEEMVIFGDRLYTDIAAGKRHGITAVLVMTGETTKEMLDQANNEDLPDLVLSDLNAASKITF